MHICRTAAVAVVALTVTLSSGALPASPQGGARRQNPVFPPAEVPVRGGIVVGTTWKADNTPLPHALVRLRSVADGRVVGVVRSDEGGEFRFGQVPSSVYVVELISAGEAILAVGELFTVLEGETATTFVRLTSRAPWFSGFFGNAAATAIATAASLGITAVGSSGTPASPQ
jgi:hypothetical protein